MSNSILQAIDICKSFPGTRALDHVDFQIARGEIVGLVGENGAGKSTLVKIITGVYTSDSGEIILESKPVSFKNSQEALQAGIAIMHQELNLYNNLSVYENIFFDNPEYRRKMDRIDKNKMRADAVGVLRTLGSDTNPEAQTGTLGIREKQIVEIARALSTSAKIIIMDEPTAALTEGEVRKLFEVIERLTERGVAIIYVSHRMSEIERICDRVVVLRDGRNAGELAMRKQNIIKDIVTLMVGREVDNFYPHQPTSAGEAILSVRGLCSGFLRDVSFDAKANEILCFYGLAGSGTTELAECIFGLQKIEKGSIQTQSGGKKMASPSASIRNGIAYVPADRRSEGIVKDMSVEYNLILSSYREDSTASFLRRKRIRDTALEYQKLFNIKMSGPEQQIMYLSGGNQQKVILSKWLKTKPRVLILNEPTRGVDIGAKAEIYAIIDNLAHSGIAVILISSEIPEVIGMCDRVLVMNRGRIVSELMSEQCSQEVLLKAASGEVG